MEIQPHSFMVRKFKAYRASILVVVTSLTLSSVGLVAASPGGHAAQVSHSPLFSDPLVWVGSQAPADADSDELLEAIGTFKTQGPEKGYAALEQFTAAHPRSAWAPALQIHLAEYYRAHGNYSLALERWESAWNETKSSTDPKAQKLAVRALAGWAPLLSSLGRKDQLESLFNELSALHLPLGTYATAIQSAKDGMGIMSGHPETSYRCGSFGLAHLAMALHFDNSTIRKLFETNSPNGGFTMSQLLALAKENGMDVVAVHRPAGAPLIVPSIVHWRLNHYAAIMEERDGRYRVEDPTFNGHVWMTAEAINAESSGDFILPSNQAPGSWIRIPDVECAKISGKGVGNSVNDQNDPGPPGCDGSDDADFEDSNCDPPSSNDGAAGGGTNNCCGMPQWSVSEPYITLWLKDTPLLYHRSDNKWVRLTLSYKSRGNAQNNLIAGFGDKWACDWLAMLQQPPGSDTLNNYLGVGAVFKFSVNHLREYKSGSVFADVSVAGIDPPAIVAPTGAESVYGYAVGYMDGTTNNFLTERIDRYGRVLERFNYETVGNVVRLTSMVDMDGRTNILAYSNATFPNLITSVTDTYGRTANFNYNSSGLLTNMVDAQGMSTYFQYDANGNITSMTTPYGTTAFEYFDGVDSNSYLARSLLITEPTGDHQLYAYRDDPPDSTCANDGYGIYRLTFHWNRKQYQALIETNFLSMGQADYQKASIKHWLHGDPTSGTTTVSDSLDSQAEPYDATINGRPGCIMYAYQGEQAPYVSYGNTDALQRITYVSSGLSTLNITRNGLGRPTSFTYQNSDGTTAVYTNIFDSSGSILLYELGPRGELLRGYGYDPVFTNLLTSVTNASGDVVRYTHDTNTMRVTSITFPSGLVRTNIYYASGPNAGFLAQQIDIGFRTNSFSYTKGNVSAATNELGLVTTYMYDSLNRRVSAAFPDGTTISNIYDKLDIVATKDRMNQWSYFGYNSVRQLLAVTNVNGQVTTYDYCGCGAPDQVIRWDGSTPFATQMSYNMGGRLTNVIYADGFQLSYVYNSYSQAQSISDSGGHELDLYWYQHNLENQIQQANFGGQQIINRQFDEYGRITNSVDRNGVITAMAYDFLNRLTNQATVDPWGQNPTAAETFSYGPNGLNTYIDALTNVTQYGRDEIGRVIQVTNANDEVSQFTYNPAGGLLTLTDGKSQVTRWNYDSYGRVTNKVDALGNVLFVYQYDALGRLTNRCSAAKGNTLFVFDPIGNLTNVIYLNGSTSNIVYRYDALNRLTNVLDAAGSTAFAWTSAGQLVSEDGPWADDTVSYDYSNRLRSDMRVAQPNADPWTQQYNYDALIRLAQVTSPVGDFSYSYNSGSGDRVQDLQYGNNWTVYANNNYDGLARLVQTALYVPGPFSSPAFQFQYAFNEGSQRTQEVFAVGGAGGNYSYKNYTYDNIGQLKSAVGFDHAYDNNAGNYVDTSRLHEQFGYSYDAAWNLNRRTNNALVQTFSVNSLNELSGVTRSGTLTVAGTASELRGDISGSPAGVTNVTVSGTGLVAGTAQIYHEGDWVMSGATLVDGDNSYTATAQDTYGRTSQDSTTVSLPANTSFTYDLNGNLLSDGARNFAYDDENQLISVWQTNAWREDFVYDGLLRRRIAKDYTWNGTWIETNETRYVYDGYLVVQERDASNSPTVTYTRGVDLSGDFQDAGGAGGLLARTDNQKLIARSSTATAYYFSDANGNVIGLAYTNGAVAARYNYDPFGRLLSMAGPLASVNKYRFSSKAWDDNSGLYYYGLRFYDPTLQRWLNRDPIGISGGINLYVFVSNDGILIVDPYGMRSFLCRASQFLKGVGSFAGGAALILVSEGPQAVVTVPSGAIGISYGVGNMVAAFAPDNPESNELAKKMEESPSNLPEAVGRAVGGQKGQAIGGVAAAASDLPHAINEGEFYNAGKAGAELLNQGMESADKASGDDNDCGCN